MCIPLSSQGQPGAAERKPGTAGAIRGGTGAARRSWEQPRAARGGQEQPRAHAAKPGERILGESWREKIDFRCLRVQSTHMFVSIQSSSFFFSGDAFVRCCSPTNIARFPIDVVYEISPRFAIATTFLDALLFPASK